MSYNITANKVYVCELTIPLSKLIGLVESDEYADISYPDRDRISIQVGESEMTGVLDGDICRIEKLDPIGEGSGSDWERFIVPLLKQTQGIYDVRQVWEGGDEIRRVKSVNGEIVDEDIE